MYKKCTVAQLKQLCEERRIDYQSLRYKRELIDVLQRYDESDIQEIENDERLFDDSTGEVGEGEGEESEGESVASEGDPPSDNVSIAAGNLPGSEKDGESNEIALMRLKVALAREKRLALEAERRVKEEERLARERTYEAGGTAQQGEGRASDRETPAATELREIKALLPLMTDDSDVLTYFMTFERVLEINCVDRSLWARILPAQLSQKALKIFARLSMEESRSYDTVKRLILDGYKLNGDSYLKSFRTLRRSGNLTYRMFLTSLRDMATRYFDAKGIDTFEKLMHAFIMEQFLNALPDAVKHFVVSKQPTSVEQAADFADLCYELSRIGNYQGGYGTNVMTGSSVRVGSPRPPGPVSTQVAGNTGPRMRGPAVRADVGRGMRYPPPPKNRFGPQFANVRPFAGNRFDNRITAFQNRPSYFANAKRTECRERYCNDSGFCQDDYDESSMCNRESLYDDVEMFESNNGHDCYVNDVDECLSDESGVRDTDVFFPVIVNETNTVVGLRDTGNMSMLIVDESLVPKTEINYDESVLCSGAFDGQTKHSRPTAIVKVRSPHFGYTGNVAAGAIVTKLPDKVKIIIGNAFFKQNRHLTDVIRSRKTTASKTPNIEPETQLSGNRNENAAWGKSVGTHTGQRNAPKSSASHAEKARQMQRESQNPRGKTIGDTETEEARGQYERGHTGRNDKLLTAGQLDSARETGHRETRVARQMDRDTTPGRERMTRPLNKLTVSDGDIRMTGNAHETDTLRDTAGSASEATRNERRSNKVNAQLAQNPSDGQMTDRAGQTGPAIRPSDACNVYMTADRRSESQQPRRRANDERLITEAATGARAAERLGRRQAARREQQLISRHTGAEPMKGRQRVSSVDRRAADRVTSDGRTNKTETDNEHDTLRQYANIDMSENDKQSENTEDHGTEFKRAQMEDPSLQIGWSHAKAGHPQFKIINGLLYKRNGQHTNSIEDYALAVPEKFRRDLLICAHDNLAAGHLGVNKTRQRLGAFFYWPRMQSHVASHIKCCKNVR